MSTQSKTWQRLATLAETLAAPPAPEPPADKPARKESPLLTKRTSPMSSLAQPERRRLGFDEYDQRVRAEMKKLAVAGVMPGHTFWKEHRDPELPTLDAIITRYGCQNAAELATKLGYAAPLGTRQAASEEAEGATVAG